MALSSVHGFGHRTGGSLSERLFKRLDSNHDNRISPGEMKGSGLLLRAGVAKSDDDEKRVFETIDSDRNGMLSRGESHAYFGALMANSPQAMAAIMTLLARDEEEAEAENLTRTAAETEQQPDPIRAGLEAYRKAAGD